MQRNRRNQRFPTTVGVATALLLGAGVLTLARGLGWLGPEGSVAQAVFLVEGSFLFAIGLLPPVLWLLSRRAPSSRPRERGRRVTASQTRP